jgi:hypothetical protein
VKSSPCLAIIPGNATYAGRPRFFVPAEREDAELKTSSLSWTRSCQRRDRAVFYNVENRLALTIRAATASAADLIDRATDVGTLWGAGKYADLIALTENPLDRI